jgi:arylsulfatase A-like enzyme
LNTYKFYAGEGGVRTPMIIAGVPGMPQNTVQAALTHVTDIVPTLLDLAQVQPPGSTYHGQTIETITGRSLLPALRGETQRIHAVDEAIGYELSGNQALFKGTLKIVKNLPPVGDGQWHLYDLSTDPGETKDLQVTLPNAFKAMLSDFDGYAKSHGVLPMPEGYSPSQQVMINSFINYWYPAYRNTVLGGLAVVVVAIVALLALRRRRSVA